MVHLEPRPAPEIDTLALALGRLGEARSAATSTPARACWTAAFPHARTRRGQECRWARHRHCRPRAYQARDLSLRPHGFAGTTDGAPVTPSSSCAASRRCCCRRWLWCGRSTPASIQRLARLGCAGAGDLPPGAMPGPRPQARRWRRQCRHQRPHHRGARPQPEPVLCVGACPSARAKTAASQPAGRTS